MTVSRHGTTCLRCCTSFVNSGGSTAAPKSWTPDQVRGDDDQQGSNRPLSVIALRSEEHTSELQSLMRISYAVFCLKKKTTHTKRRYAHQHLLIHYIPTR